MPLHNIHVDPETIARVEQGGQSVVVYECKLQEVPCGMFLEGTTSAISAHLRGHGMTGPDHATQSCTWDNCSKTLRNGSMTRHILTHLGVKVRCSMCGVVKCRHDLLRAHIKSSELCHFAFAQVVHAPGACVLAPTTSWASV
jgi:hypothetical protein